MPDKKQEEQRLEFEETLNPIEKAAWKKFTSIYGKKMEEAADKVPPQQILENSGLLKRLMEYSQITVSKKGTMTGIIPAIGQATRGEGFKPFAPRQEAIGLGPAIQIMGLQQQQEAQQAEAPKRQIDIIKGLLDIAIKKGDPELLRQMGITKSAKDRYEEQKFRELLGEPVGQVTPPKGLPSTDLAIPAQGDTKETLLGREARLKKEALLTEQKIKAKGEVFKLNEKSRANFSRVASMFSNIVAQVKGAEEEQGGLGLGPGLRGQFGVLIKDPKFSRTASAYGQRVETALSMNSILTGQNRVIRSVVSMVLKSLPDQRDPDTTVAAKIAQSMKNAYMITKAWQKAALTPEQLKSLPTTKLTVKGKTYDVVDVTLPPFQLSPEENAEIEKIISDILATPAAKVRTLGREDISPQQALEELKRRGLE